ncbi:MAG: hypothetical protein AAFX54_11365 [Pseudomonadota bacterium]
MSDEHPFHIDIHARAFSLMWSALDEKLEKMQSEYKKKPTNEEEQEEKFYMGIFTEAAHSHLIVISACTLLESLLTHEFRKYGAWFKKYGDDSHFRWQAPDQASFNPRYYFRENGKVDRSNFIKGHVQLCEACNIESYLNEEFSNFVVAMLHYRNSVVHNGLEWGKDNIQEFRSKVGKKSLEKYFTKATSGDKDWIYTPKSTTILKLRSHANLMIGDFDRILWDQMFRNFPRRLQLPSDEPAQ